MSRKRLLSGVGIFLLTWIVSVWDSPLKTLWPVVVALALVILTRKAIWGLLLGAFAGSLLLCGGDPWQAYLEIFSRHLAPSLQSSWKVGAILFTLTMGGFAAILNEGGGFQAVLRLFIREGANAAKRFQAAAAGLGILCFFDGLANSMMVGRVCRDMSEPCGVSKVKLSYIVDSTSSAVACIAFVSTWIAYQLTMIRDGFRIAGLEVNPYVIFVRSIPFNFYCWFTLVLLFVSIARRYNPGPMQSMENGPGKGRFSRPETLGHAPAAKAGGFHSVMIPMIALILSFFAGFYLLGCPGPKWPVSTEKIAAAFGSDAGPLVLVVSGLIASVAAVAVFPARGPDRLIKPVTAFASGARSLFGPVLILVAAWIIGSVLGALETAVFLSALVSETEAVVLVPALIFVTGSLISFSTGTSWGTMGILFPLSIPIAATAAQSMAPGGRETYMLIGVAAVFSGAVFGDHCSPFSDTTIVSSISCGVEPHDHIRTQIPYALITAAVAVLFGFIPAAMGMPPLLLLPLGAVFLVLLPSIHRRFRPQIPVSSPDR